MNSISIPTTTQDSTSQDTLVLTRTANKVEMLKRLDQVYHLGNQAYERIGNMIDTVCDKRSAVEAFQATDEFSTAQVDQLFQAFSQVLEVTQDMS